MPLSNQPPINESRVRASLETAGFQVARISKSSSHSCFEVLLWSSGTSLLQSVPIDSFLFHLLSDRIRVEAGEKGGLRLTWPYWDGLQPWVHTVVMIAWAFEFFQGRLEMTPIEGVAKIVLIQLAIVALGMRRSRSI